MFFHKNQVLFFIFLLKFFNVGFAQQRRRECIIFSVRHPTFGIGIEISD